MKTSGRNVTIATIFISIRSAGTLRDRDLRITADYRERVVGAGVADGLR